MYHTIRFITILRATRHLLSSDLKDGTSSMTVFWIEGNVFSIGAFGSSRIQEIIENGLQGL